MEQEAFLRLSLIQQDQAPQTLDKYICRIAEVILFDSEIKFLSADELCTKMADDFLLSFDIEEIKRALAKKGKPQIQINDDRYFLSPAAMSRLRSQVSVDVQLDSYISMFLDIYPEYKSFDLKSLLMNYIYHCFNSTTQSLMNLVQSKKIRESESFSASNNEIEIINNFVSWDNSDKNQFLYFLISMCYEYCMLTVKQNSLLSKRIFQGKRFFLDANIIFRMAGVNNDERQYVSKSFVEKCKEVGIELCYTDTTLDELYRVINNEISRIRSITGQQEPINYVLVDKINDRIELNNFYRLYYDWSKQPSNDYSDFESFQRYLFSIIEAATKNLILVRNENFEISREHSKFIEGVKDLKDYKTSYRRPTNEASARTDISNIMLVMQKRESSHDSIWNTNEFMVSADQLLIGWASKKYSGVPIVVVPSIWLAIILRFAGRSKEDYRSFCLFLNLRPHIISDSNINTIGLLRELNKLTSDAPLKERIVRELIENKSKYALENAADYIESAEKAFDVVLAEHCKNNQEQMDALRDEFTQEIHIINQSKSRDTDDRARESQERALIVLSKTQASEKVKVFRIINRYSRGINWVICIIALMAVLGWTKEIPFVHTFCSSLIPSQIVEFDAKFAYLQWLLTILTGILLASNNGLFPYLAGVERENRIYLKRLKINREALQSSQKES